MPNVFNTLTLIDLLKKGPQNIKSIMDHFKGRLTPRQIRLNIDVIKSLGYDKDQFETTGPANRKTWFIRQTNEDRVGKWLIRGVLPQVFSSKRQEFLYELNDWLTPEDDPIIESTHFYETVAHDHLDNQLKTIIQAINNGQEIRITAMNGDATSVASLIQLPIEVMPVRIIYHRGCFYVAAAVSNREQSIRTFQIDQLQLKPIDGFFDRDSFLGSVDKDLRTRFGVSENIDGNVYDIKLRFSGGTGRFINQQFWTENVVCQPEGDGWLVEFQCGINRELVGWIFQWMSNVRVVAPLRLKELYDEQLQKMLTITDESPDAPLVFSNAFAPVRED